MPNLLQDLRLAIQVSVRHLQDDPVWFGVQVLRRLPRTWRRWLLPPIGSQPTLWNALTAFLADQPLVAADRLAKRHARHPSRSRGLAAKLAAQVGAESVLDATKDAKALALAALNKGDLEAAEKLFPKPSDRAVVRALKHGLEPGSTLAAPHSVAAYESGVGTLMVLTNSLPHTHSGYTARSHSLLTAIAKEGWPVAATTRIGYPVTIGHLGAGDASNVDGITYHRLQAASWPRNPNARLQLQVEALAKLVAQVRPAVLHTTTDYPNALVTKVVAEAFGLPWVYEMRGQLELSWVASRPPAFQAAAAESARVQLMRAKETELAAAADAVIVLSATQAADLVGRGVPGAKVQVAPNSVDERLFSQNQSPEASRMALGLPAAGVWFGTVSSLVDYEGLDVFLRGLAQARGNGVDARGAIVGDGVSRPSLVALAKELGIDSFVVFPGRVSRSAAISWHQALDVFVVPRRDTPVCRVVTPLKPVEAMALGRPVLASELPALAEVVAGGGGRVVAHDEDWAAAIIELASNRDHRVLLGARARESAQHRTWRDRAVEYVSLYQGLVTT